MNLDELLAREGVRDTIARYAHCADSGRFDELVRLFSEDGVMDVEGREPLRGRDAIRAFLGSTQKSLQQSTVRPFIRHHVNSVQIDVDGEGEARAASYFFAITERGPDHWGRYRDRLVRRGDLWLFASRKVRVDGRAEGGWSATNRQV
jgi:hypothetical protein